MPRRTTLPRLRSSCPQALTHGGVALSERPFACATRSTASSSPLSRASSAAARPTEAHHIRFAQPRALGRKVSDEYTVPVCRLHHRDLHRYGDEASWWAAVSIDPLPIALELWKHSQLGATAEDCKTSENPSVSVRATWPENGNHETPANLRAAIQDHDLANRTTDYRWAQEPMIGSIAACLPIVSHPFPVFRS